MNKIVKNSFALLSLCLMSHVLLATRPTPAAAQAYLQKKNKESVKENIDALYVAPISEHPDATGACSICQENLQNLSPSTENIVQTHCGHSFHESCTVDYLSDLPVGSGKSHICTQNCPNCRQPLRELGSWNDLANMRQGPFTVAKSMRRFTPTQLAPLIEACYYIDPTISKNEPKKKKKRLDNNDSVRSEPSLNRSGNPFLL